MKYLLDTNICIYLIKHHPKQVLEKFKTIPAHQIAISAITHAELEYGVAKSHYPEKSQAALDRFTLALEIIPFNHQAAVRYGKLRTELQKSGALIGPLDMLIAAHSLSLNAILITNNDREFSRVNGLLIENWTKH